MADVFDLDLLDALQHDRVEIDLGAKGNRGQQRQFVPGVDTAEDLERARALIEAREA